MKGMSLSPGASHASCWRWGWQGDKSHPWPWGGRGEGSAGRETLNAVSPDSRREREEGGVELELLRAGRQLRVCVNWAVLVTQRRPAHRRPVRGRE